MEDKFSRTEEMFGSDALNKLKNSNVAIFGVGGVGGYVVEILARSGISNFCLIDDDTVNITNINRQIIATTSTIGLNKVDVAKKRILDINPEANVETKNMFYLPDNANDIDLSRFNYVVDCIDTIAGKIELAKRCKELNVPMISSMGSRNKLDFTKFKVGDIFESRYDKLAKIMRKLLRRNGVSHLKVAYSNEDSPLIHDEKINRHFTQSSPFGPAAMGIIIGNEVMKDIIYGTSDIPR